MYISDAELRLNNNKIQFSLIPYLTLAYCITLENCHYYPSSCMIDASFILTYVSMSLY